MSITTVVWSHPCSICVSKDRSSGCYWGDVNQRGLLLGRPVSQVGLVAIVSLGKLDGSRLAGLTPLLLRYPIWWASIVIRNLNRKQLPRHWFTLEDGIGKALDSKCDSMQIMELPPLELREIEHP